MLVKFILQTCSEPNAATVAAAAKATAANGSDGVEDEDEDLEEALEMEISEKDEL